MAKKRVPIYLFLGFLESGKTTVIKDFLENNDFSGRDKNLILLCEEGEAELSERLLKLSRSKTEVCGSEDAFTAAKLQELDKKYRPTAVIIEWNGFWPVAAFDYIDLPEGWFVFQVVALVNAQTFEVYQQNMKDKFADCYRYADIVVFNRCDKSTRQQDIRRTVKALNRRAAVYFESEDPAFEAEPPELPYSLDDDPIKVGFEDFGAWFIDMQDNPAHYDGKRVEIAGYLGKMAQDGKAYEVFGRSGMACCANDLVFLGLKGTGAVFGQFQPREKAWGTVRGTLHLDSDESGELQDCSLEVEDFVREAEPRDAIVYFN